MAGDVFTRVEEGLWAALEGNAAWASYVKLANRIKHVGDEPNKQRDDVVVSDLPEFRLFPTNGHRDKHTSTTVNWVQDYACQLFTGDQRTSRFLNPIKFMTWAVIESTPVTLSGVAGTELLKVEFIELNDEMELDPQTNRPAGWQSFGVIRVELKFLKANLLTIIGGIDPPVGV